MRIKSAYINAQKLPNMFNKMEKDLYEFYQENKQQTPEPEYYNDNHGEIYSYKLYDMNLFGWSGLDNWYNSLLKRKQTNKNIPLYKNIYLDPTLCIREISNKQADLFVKITKRYNLNESQKWVLQNKIRNKKSQLKIALVICQKSDSEDQSVGKYGQQQQAIYIKWNSEDFQEMHRTLLHEFVHYLDHITSLTIQENLQKLQRYNNTYAPEDSNQETYTIDKNHNVGLFYDSLEKEYEPTYQEMKNQIKQCLEDVGFYSSHYYLQAQTLLYFVYLTSFNPIKKIRLQQDQLIKKINQNSDKSQNVINCFKYCENLSKAKKIIYSLNYIFRNYSKTYFNTMERCYSDFKNLYLEQTELSKKVLK